MNSGRAIALVPLLALGSCRGATQITLTITADDCSNLTETAIAVGSAGSVDGNPFVAESTSCVNGRVGQLVIVPAGAKDSAVAIKVVASLGKAASTCPTTGSAPGCIVERRLLQFEPHSNVDLDVVLWHACAGVVCDAENTCSNGVCVPAACSGDSCTNTTPADAGPDTVTVPDVVVPPAPAAIYAISSNALWTFDVTHHAINEIGVLSGACSGDGLTGIALTSDGKLYGTSPTTLYLINPATASCTKLGATDAGRYPGNLATVAAGALAATETLVTLNGTEYDKIQLDGTIIKVGSGALQYPANGGITASSIDRGKLFIAANVQPCRQCLVQIDTTSGDYKMDLGQLPGATTTISGLASSPGPTGIELLYAFAQDGTVFEMQLKPNATSFSSTPYVYPNSKGWYGAASAPWHSP
jgi:hypothetical protein